MPPRCPALGHSALASAAAPMDTQSSLSTSSLSTETSWHGQIPLMTSLKYSDELGVCAGIPRSFLAFSPGCFQQEFCWFPCTHSQRGGGLRNPVRVPSLWLCEPNASDGVRYSVSRRLLVEAAKSFNFPTHLLNVYLLLQTGLCGLI